jgi:hypothetical protein
MGLVFDQDALRLALEALQVVGRSIGGAGQSWLDYDRVYLSRATLVVVPAVLIGHWQQQIQVSPHCSSAAHHE